MPGFDDYPRAAITPAAYNDGRHFCVQDWHVVRLDTTRAFVAELDRRPRFLRLHEPDLLAVAFLYVPTDVDLTEPDIDRINQVNQAIHRRILAEGRWYLHQFSIVDPGRLRHGAILHPLRFMGANLRIEQAHIEGVLDYVEALGADATRQLEPIAEVCS